MAITEFQKYLHARRTREFDINNPNLALLQVVQDQKNPVFLKKRKTDLEVYLKEVREVAGLICWRWHVVPIRFVGIYSTSSK